MLIQGGTFILDSRVHYNWPGLDMKTKISERASKYALGKNEMTGVAGRPRQPGRPRQGPGRPRQAQAGPGKMVAGRQAGRLADWQAGSLLWQPGCIRNGSG